MDAEQLVHDVAEKVRALITDAEAKAAEIVNQAEADAKRIREQASAESEERLAAARSAFDELQSKLGIGAEMPDAPPPAPEPAPPPPAPAPAPAPEPEPPLIPEPTPPPDEGTPPQIKAEPSANGAGTDDPAAARLVAMNMALDGASREAIKDHLVGNYSLADADSVVDDVMQLAGK